MITAVALTIDERISMEASSTARKSGGRSPSGRAALSRSLRATFSTSFHRVVDELADRDREPRQSSCQRHRRVHHEHGGEQADRER
jgi:hypothetical protein